MTLQMRVAHKLWWDATNSSLVLSTLLAPRPEIFRMIEVNLAYMGRRSGQMISSTSLTQVLSAICTVYVTKFLSMLGSVCTYDESAK